MARPDRRIEAHLRDWRAGNLSANELVIDVLVTLRHFADAHAVDHGEADRIAYSHYLEEKSDGPPTVSA